MTEPQATLTEREQFEAWLRDNRYDASELQPGLYLSPFTRNAWLAWQARAALSTAPVQGVLTDDEIRARCEAAGIQWLPADDDPDGFPGSFDMASMAEMRAALASAPHPPSNTLGDALTGPGDPVASLPAPPIAAGEVRSDSTNTEN